MTELERALAITEIQQLAHRYAVYLDARDLDRLVGLYVPDVRVGKAASGHAALRADFARALRAVGVTFLHVGNHVVDFADDAHASGIVYTRGEIQDGGPESTRWIVQAIQYHDTYEKREGRWLFARRRHLLVYGAELGANPLTLPPAEWPKHQTGRGSLPFDLETWQRFWKREEP
ncbi:MAG TPA: nuclear transport factor 2 family protein [Myxococcota bacterium]|nr:nuclear transport factor 2 family protein [Myxococcota bacterium]